MRIYDNRPSFYQWDIDQKIVHNFQVGDEVHFSNPKQEVALMVKAYQLGDEVVADVPNILLQSAYPITIYCMHLSDDCKYTKEKFTISVKQRRKPEGYVYTETEVLSYESLDKRVKKLELGGGGGGIDPEAIEEIVNDALEEAKNSGKFDGRDGKDGKDGEDGKTPYIQDGYWYINGTNTGVKAEGKDGVGGGTIDEEAIQNFEFISVEDIDRICGSSIEYVSWDRGSF